MSALAEERKALIIQGLQRCKRCAEVKPLEKFHKRSSTACGRAGICAQCRSESRGHTYRVEILGRRNVLLRHKYGLTDEDLERMLSEQGGGCAICSTTDPGGQGVWSVDHDHSCCPTTKGRRRACHRCIRGLLCHRCNLALGMFKDDPVRVRAALEYLAAYSARKTA